MKVYIIKMKVIGSFLDENGEKMRENEDLLVYKEKMWLQIELLSF